MYLITSLTMVSNITWNVVNKFDRRRSGKWVATAVKGFTLFISNEDVNDIIKIIKWLEDSGLLIDGVTKTVKGEIKKKTRRWVSWCLLSTFRYFISTISGLFGGKRYKSKRS